MSYINFDIRFGFTYLSISPQNDSFQDAFVVGAWSVNGKSTCLRFYGNSDQPIVGVRKGNEDYLLVRCNQPDLNYYPVGGYVDDIFTYIYLNNSVFNKQFQPPFYVSMGFNRDFPPLSSSSAGNVTITDRLFKVVPLERTRYCLFHFSHT